MDVSVINPFLSACEEAFVTMFNIVPQHKEPYLLNPTATHMWEISGLVAVSGDELGIVVFRLHRRLASKMLELSEIPVESPEEMEEMEKGLVSEFTNIITGNAVSAIKSKNISVSAPDVRAGENHVIPWPKSTRIIAVPFYTKEGIFEVYICFKGM
jgi:chemotaxis protein CheX